MKWIRTGVPVAFILALGVALVLGRGDDTDEATVGSPSSIGTFNIRFFPAPETDRDQVAARIAEMNAGAFAVQEIVDESAFSETLARASELTGRQYRVVLGRYCGEWDLRLGIVWDAERYDLEGIRDREQLDPDGSHKCREGYPPAMLAVLAEKSGGRLPFMSIHFQCCGEDWQHRRRREEWRRLLESLPELEEEFGAPVVVAGDFNSVGFDDDEGGERGFIDEQLSAAGRKVLPADQPCTEYWQPPDAGGDYAVSALDHVLVPIDDARFTATTVLGMCRTLACEATHHDDFDRVSDHCPVVVTGR